MSLPIKKKIHELMRPSEIFLASYSFTCKKLRLKKMSRASTVLYQLRKIKEESYAQLCGWETSQLQNVKYLLDFLFLPGLAYL